MVTTKVKNFLKRATDDIESAKKAELWLIAKKLNLPLPFPEMGFRQTVIDDVPMSQLFGTKANPEWIKRWLAKWPTRTKSGLSYSPRTAYPQTAARMQKFFKEQKQYGLDLDTDEMQRLIDQATDAYLAEQESKNWYMTKKAIKFISDTDGSVLAEWMQNPKECKTRRTILR